MDAKTFWKFVAKMKNELDAEHAARVVKYTASGDIRDLAGQNENGKSLFISSKSIPGVQTAGSVSEATYGLAALRLCESSHEIATAKEIARFLAKQEASRVEVNAMNRRAQERQGMISVAVEPLTPRVK